jgi:asparagine synthase (glutamine-hydrolysing)
MIFGIVGDSGAPEPASVLGSRLHPAGSVGTSIARFAQSGHGTSYNAGGVVVVAESGDTRCHGLDAAAVAAAYGRFGYQCLERLPGRFRFLLYDADAQRLFAASSTAPPLPLAYWSDQHTTVITSRLLALLAFPQVPRALDERYVAHLVMGLSSMPNGTTALRGVRRLCPGEALIVDPQGARVKIVDRLTPRAIGRQELAGGALVEQLGATVEAAREGGSSVLSLSGGLDSAALAGATLRRATELPALSFIAPRLNGAAEIPAIDSIERTWPNLHVARIDVSNATSLPDLGPDLRDDAPLTPIALLPARMQLWSKAREAGFRAVIEGEGGDELFSMLPTPLDSLRRGHVGNAARHILQSRQRRSLLEHAIWLPVLPDVARRAWLLRRNPIDTHLPAFAAWNARQHPLIREVVDEHLDSFVHKPFADRLNEWLSAPAVVGAALSRRHLAATFGLELEWPMLERGVLELVLGLHEGRDIRGGPEKPFLQEAVQGIVPDGVRLLRKDVGLYEAFIPRVLTSPLAREAIADIRVRHRLADLVRFERIDGMLDGLAAGRSLGEGALWHLECVVSFAEWYARASREHGVD